VRSDLEHAGDDERRQLGVQRLDGVDRGAEHREARGDVHGVEIAAEEVLEPAEGDVHPVVIPRERSD
jgi:hypothetical protein